MKITSYFENLFNVKEDEETSDFNKVLIEIIDDTFEKKNILHQNYNNLIKKVWVSDKSDERKLKMAKYLLGRLAQESSFIYLKASILAKRLCPCCNDQQIWQQFRTTNNSIH